MTQVMLSHPVPSPDVSGAKQCSSSCQENMWGLGLKTYKPTLFTMFKSFRPHKLDDIMPTGKYDVCEQ